jgi:hypothetical protein
VAIYRIETDPGLIAPAIVVAFDSWIDAGSAATVAATRLAGDGDVVATFDPDTLFDYRARRPALEIVDGRLRELEWPELVVRRARLDDRDLLVLAGPEPDYHWRALTDGTVDLVRALGVTQWISLGAIPGAVPHTRPVPILGTESTPGLLRGDVTPGPAGTLRVPAAALSALEMAVAKAGIDAVGYFAQVPHYLSGPYPAAAAALIRAVGRHLGVDVPAADLEEEAAQLSIRIDTAAAVDDTTRGYVERLEAMVDEERLPVGDDLIADIERFLRDRPSEGSERS